MYARDYSVVVCVYTEDRWEHITAAIQSLRKQSRACSEIIVVVDHNPSLYERIVATMPDITIVENNGEKGLSGARNTGVARAGGEIIAFLDDDAAAEQDWLERLDEAYADPAVIGVGGMTVPNWQTAAPWWMPAEFYWVVGCNYLGMPPSGAPVRNLLGGNMSFRRVAFDLVDGFRPGIGRTAGKRPLGCEETEFCIRLGRKSPDSVLVIEHRAVVRHFVSEQRCRFSYFLSRCYAEGISKARVTDNVGSTDGLSAERAYLTRTLPAGVVRGIADVCRGRAGGLGRAGSIIAGTSVTALGYLMTKARQSAERPGRVPRLRTT